LVVDDEPEALRLIKSMVEPLGYEVLPLADSREAARRLETEKFDGIVLDVLMPYLDGFDLARRARASPLNRRAPVLMITALHDAGTMRQCFALGVTFVLPKPFTYEQICGLFTSARGAMLRERRQHARLPFCTTVECRAGKLGEICFRAVSLNLGEEGMLLEPSGGLNVGEDVILEFALPRVCDPWDARRRVQRSRFLPQPPAPEPALRTVAARIVRKEPPDRIAVRFTVLSEEDRNLIQRYIMGRVTF
jgi:CheY-like chemotaxis protein